MGGFRAESNIADAICKNPRLIKIGMKFEFKDVLNRVSRHLIRNMDTNRRNRKISKIEDTSISINDIENENALENSLVETIEENASMEEPSSTVKDIEDSASKD